MTRLLLAVVLLVVVGCGGVENEPNLAAAIDRTEATGSSLIAIDAIEKDGGQTAEFRCKGGADYAQGRLQLGCDVGGSAAYEFIAIGKATFIRGDLLGVASVGSEKWTKYSDEEGLGATFTPQQLLSTLRAASEETRRIGEEDVRGVETVRYQLEVDCDQEDLIHCDGETAPVDVWVGADGLVRRISIDDRSVSATIEFYDFGADVDVEAPPADQVQDLDVLGNPRPCSDTQGDPISVGRTLGALRANGFEVEEPDCATLIATFGATSVSGNGGHLSCFLFAEPRGGAPTTIRRRGVDGADAELELHNLTCTILVDSPTGEATIDRLEAAFAELERQIRP